MGVKGKPRGYISSPMELVMKCVTKGSVDECWPSSSPLRSKNNPYPVVKVGGRNGKVEYCHLIVFEDYYGYRPTEGEVMHLCNNKICENPHHLHHGTVSENKLHQFATAKGIPVSEYVPCRQTIARMKPKLESL